MSMARVKSYPFRPKCCVYLVPDIASNTAVTSKSEYSRSLKMASIARSYTTYYWSAIVSIALSVTVFELLDVEEYRDLEIYVRGQSWSLKWYHSHTVVIYGRIFRL